MFADALEFFEYLGEIESDSEYVWTGYFFQGMSWAGPVVGRPGVGPGRAGPSQANQVFIWWAEARPRQSIINMMGRGPAGPSFFRRMGRGSAQRIAFSKLHGPVRAMTSAASPGRSAISVGRLVDLTGRPKCCPVRKGVRICADVLFFAFFISFSFVFSCCLPRARFFLPMRYASAHTPTNHRIILH